MTEIKEKLYETINKILLVDKEKITDDLTMKDVEEWDSMAHLMIVSELEQIFEIILEDDDIIAMTSVGNILSILNKYLSD